MKIGPHDLAKAPIVVAEIGNNHEGDYGLAAELIHLAAKAGAHAVKFQTIDPGHLADSPERLEQLNRICLPWERFHDLEKVARHEGVLFMSTAFNLAAVEYLKPLVPCWKLASRSYDDFVLSATMYQTGKPVLASCGMGSPPWYGPRMIPMHCVSDYPTAPEDAEVPKVAFFAKGNEFVGYSDHTLGTRACILAAGYGARVIEKHFTIAHDHSDFRDHQLSATPEQLREIVDGVAEAAELAKIKIGSILDYQRGYSLQDEEVQAGL